MLAAFEAVLSTNIATAPVPLGSGKGVNSGGVVFRRFTQKKRKKPDKYVDWFPPIE
jgi:hypothetical protein